MERTAIYRSFYELKPIAAEPIAFYCSKLQNYRRLLNNAEQAITDEAFLCTDCGLPLRCESICTSLSIADYSGYSLSFFSIG